MNWIIFLFLFGYSFECFCVFWRCFTPHPDLTIIEMIGCFPIIVVALLIRFIIEFFEYKKWEDIKIFKRKE